MGMAAARPDHLAPAPAFRAARTLGCDRPIATLVVVARGPGCERSISAAYRSLRRDDRFVIVDATGDPTAIDPFAFAPAVIAGTIEEAIDVARATTDVVVVIDATGSPSVVWFDQVVSAAEQRGEPVVHTVAPESQPAAPNGAATDDIETAAARTSRRYAEAFAVGERAAAAVDTAAALVRAGHPGGAMEWGAWSNLLAGARLGDLVLDEVRAALGDGKALARAAATDAAGAQAMLAAVQASVDAHGIEFADAVFRSAWPALAELHAAGVADLGPALERVDDADLRGVLARIRLATLDAVDAVADALWTDRPGNATVAALAASIGAGLPVERALEWSARLRSLGLDAHCPLVAIAQDPGRDARDRVRAASVAAGGFNDMAAAQALLDAATALDDDEVTDAFVDVFTLAPEQADAFLLAAASTPSRARLLADCLAENGATDGAEALRDHADAMAAAGAA